MVPSSTRSRRHPLAELSYLAGAILALAAVTAAYGVWLGVRNPMVVGLSYLLIVLLVAATSTLRVAVAASVLALPALNYFFMPPVGTFTLEDPQNWVALFVFLAVSVVASRLSLMARSRAEEALAQARRTGPALRPEPRHPADDGQPRGHRRDSPGTWRAGLVSTTSASACLAPTGWRVHGSSDAVTLERSELDMALATARGALEFDAHTRTLRRASAARR